MGLFLLFLRLPAPAPAPAPIPPALLEFIFFSLLAQLSAPLIVNVMLAKLPASGDRVEVVPLALPLLVLPLVPFVLPLLVRFRALDWALAMVVVDVESLVARELTSFFIASRFLFGVTPLLLLLLALLLSPLLLLLLDPNDFSIFALVKLALLLGLIIDE